MIRKYSKFNNKQQILMKKNIENDLPLPIAFAWIIIQRYLVQYHSKYHQLALSVEHFKD